MPSSSTAGLAPPAPALGRSAATAYWRTARAARRPTSIGALALRDPVHRPRLLHLLPRADRIAFLQELGESRSRRLGDLVLQFLGQVRKGHVWMDRLDVAKQLVGQTSGRALQRRDRVDD